jgi:predicted nucleotidyltransferase
MGLRLSMGFIENYTNEINELCKYHKVKSLYAFGSILTDKFTDKSDIDLIVDFQPINLLDYADNYFDLKFSLEAILNREIDLLEAKAIKNPYFLQSVNSSKQLIYEC